MNIQKPILNEQLNFYKNYVEKALGKSLFESFEQNTEAYLKMFAKVNPANEEFAYEEGKWTVKQVIKHVADVERIFAYRALAVSRKDPEKIPGFDENLYAENDDTNQIDYQTIIEEWKAVRQSTILLYKTFSLEALSRTGIVNNTEQNALTIGWVITGHAEHHLQVLKERYFLD